MKPINLIYFDPRTSLFRAGKSDREYVKLFECNNCENCNAYEKGLCVMTNVSLFSNYSCPEGKIDYKEGYTKYASKCGDLISSYKKNYPDILFKLKGLNHLEKCGDYIYLALPDWFKLNHQCSYNWDSSEDIKQYQQSLKSYFNDKIIEKYFVKVENFDLDFICHLLDFRPLALMGGVIKEYQDKYIPKFLYELKKYFTDLFNSLQEIRPEILNVISKITFVGKRAKISTLSSGKVKFGAQVVDWNREENKIYSDQNVLISISVKKAKVTIEPESDIIVEIIDDNTVNDQTEFE